METISRVQAAYDRIAAEYVRVNAEMPPELVTLAQEMVHLVGNPAHIIDIGCGHGRDMAWFGARDTMVTGIDLSAGMLTQARRLVTGELLMMDMRNLAFQSAQFDGAWCCASLLHLPKHEAPCALEETRRVLKLGGVLVLSIQEGSGEGWEGGYGEGVERYFARYEESEMKALLANGGFVTRDVSASRVGSRTWLTFVCLTR
jgi:ubiquinone/menaquinone biosynthesis C-methylase UbiE